MKTRSIVVRTAGKTDIIAITSNLCELIREEAIDEGIIFLSVIGFNRRPYDDGV